MKLRQQFSSVIISLLVHAVVLTVMAAFHIVVNRPEESFVIETMVLDEERDEVQFQQELDDQEQIVEELNFVPGSISTDLGQTEAPQANQKEIDQSQILEEPEIKVRAADVTLPGRELLGEDLGADEVRGEVGAAVSGYGAALDRLTQELIRLMRSHRLLVVWLFDESESMKDDQKKIQSRIYRVYQELKLIEDDAKASAAGIIKRGSEDILLTSVSSFGEKYHIHTPNPTSDIPKIMQAIDTIPIDRTGKENMCQALLAALGKYRGVKTQANRKVVLVVVSDESGDDGQLVEDTLHQAELIDSPIYILGREAVFGSLYAHVRWRHPQTGHVHKLPIRRGPETPFAELLQFDGYERRRDAHMSGFGPYTQVRLARNTGGIFFKLPHKNDNLNGYDGKNYDLHKMREYRPDISSRRKYAAQRNASDFRRAIWEVIVMLNPYNENNKELEVPKHQHFSINAGKATPKVRSRIQDILQTLGVLGKAQLHLEKVRELRKQEPSLRWRANYDLITAQLFAYRVRLFEYAIGLDQFLKTLPQREFKNPKTNAWSVGHGVKKLILPDKAQAKLLNVTPEQLKEARQQALDGFKQVQKAHPDTPWAQRAQWELGRRFGVRFREHYHRPQPPRPKRKKKKKPIPPPKL